MERRNRARGTRLHYIIGPMILAVIVVGIMPINGAFWAAAAAGTGGLAWRGIKQWRTVDPTLTVRVWTRPEWTLWLFAGACGLGGILSVLGTLTDPGSAGGTLGFTLLAWGAATGLAVRLLVRDGISVRTASISEAEAVASRANTAHFLQAGLSGRSVHSGHSYTPDMLRAGVDGEGRPYYVAQILAGEQTIDTWRKAGPRLASAWHVPRVIVESEATNIVRVTAVLHEFMREGAVPWTPVDLDAQDPMPVAEYLRALPLGEMATSTDRWVLNLAEVNGVIGGIPGAGKSVLLADLLGHMLRHPHIEVGYVDIAKVGAEVRWCRERLSAVATTQEEACRLVEWLYTDAQNRYREMDRIMPVDEEPNAWTTGYLGAARPVRVLVIDEAARVFGGATAAQRRMADEAAERVTGLVQVARAAGYIVLLATQKPTAVSIPPSVRDICGLRISYKQASWTGAVATLGDEWAGGIDGADSLASPTQITDAQRGRAVVADDRGRFVMVQTAFGQRKDLRPYVMELPPASEWPWQQRTRLHAVPEPEADLDPESPRGVASPLPAPPSIPTLRSANPEPNKKTHTDQEPEQSTGTSDEWRF